MSRRPLDLAHESLRAAHLLATRGLVRDAISRAYYAVFHAARDAVLSRGSQASTHKGVASEFSRLLVATGEVSATTSKVLRRLGNARSEADYDDGSHFSGEDAADLIASAERFIAEVGRVLTVDGAVPSGWLQFSDLQKRDLVAQLTREMDKAAEALQFEKAAELRDSITQIEATLAA